MIYALASPISGLISYFALVVVTNEESNNLNINYWVGIALLVSVGTFLYVTTMHILPEVYMSPNHHHHEHGKVEVHSDRDHTDKHYHRSIELGTLVVALYTPILLTFIHHDH